MKNNFFAKLKRTELDRNQRHCAIEKTQDIEKSRRDFFSYYDGAVIPLWAALAFNVPILDRSNDVAFIERAQHHLHFVINFFLSIAHQKIDTPALGLMMLSPRDLKIAKS